MHLALAKEFGDEIHIISPSDFYLIDTQGTDAMRSTWEGGGKGFAHSTNGTHNAPKMDYCWMQACLVSPLFFSQPLTYAALCRTPFLVPCRQDESAV